MLSCFSHSFIFVHECLLLLTRLLICFELYLFFVLLNKKFKAQVESFKYVKEKERGEKTEEEDEKKAKLIGNY